VWVRVPPDVYFICFFICFLVFYLMSAGKPATTSNAVRTTSSTSTSISIFHTKHSLASFNNPLHKHGSNQSKQRTHKHNTHYNGGICRTPAQNHTFNNISFKPRQQTFDEKKDQSFAKASQFPYSQKMKNGNNHKCPINGPSLIRQEHHF